jgi:hypothetical protein
MTFYHVLSDIEIGIGVEPGYRIVFFNEFD